GGRLHGRLTVQSEVGRGSTFTLSIDLSKAGMESRGFRTRMVKPADLSEEGQRDSIASTTRRAPAIPVLSGNILLAEDARDISNIMSAQLESAGARVTVVDNGPDAVENAYDGDFDVLIMDIHMPGMDGITAIKEIRNRGVQTPIIVISADSSEQRCRECSEAGADGFVPKPFQRIPFLTEVRRHLKKTADTGNQDMQKPIRSDLDLSSPRMAAVIAEFVDTLDRRVEQMETALQKNDTETITRLAHQLKGAGGINGYMCVSDLARQIEESLARADRAAVQRDLHKFRSFAERIRAGL
ncbi:MAG: response regulator, partial [Phycisphaerae bacterium]|nr:response regulator [Phycisphaerae bacterium]